VRGVEVKPKQIVVGVLMFRLVLMCMNAFYKAVYKPFEQAVYRSVYELTGIEDEWLTNLIILILFTAILIALGASIPFVYRTARR